MRTWILGAPDPEMNEIESILRAKGETVVHATDAAGNRVHGGNAYKAILDVPLFPIWVECAPSPGGALPGVVIDHHRPGDVGFNAPPADYWSASSLGQVCCLLDVEPDDRLRAIAAADHCPGPAYRGQCPGVDPQAMLVLRATNAARFRLVQQGKPNPTVAEEADMAAKIVREIREAVDLLRIANDVLPNVRDLRNVEVPSLPEAALRTGMGYLSVQTERTGRKKVVLGGDNAPETVRAFLGTFVPANGLVEPYGVPERGYAGAYIP